MLVYWKYPGKSLRASERERDNMRVRDESIVRQIGEVKEMAIKARKRDCNARSKSI